MKRLSFIICHLSFSVALVAFTACSSSEDSIIDEPANPTTPKVYTMTVTASKADNATTRALSLDGKTLNATWKVDDVIKVLKKDRLSIPAIYRDLGTLKATTVSADGLTATFTGSFTGSYVTAAGGIAEYDKLLLAYPGTRLRNTSGFTFDYTGQDGTLETIASDYDYCMTSTVEDEMVTVSKVSDTGEVSTTGTASFDNQQAIVRFTLKDAGGNAICPTRLDITADDLVESVVLPASSSGITPISTEKTLTLSLDGSTNVIYAALRGISNKTVKLTSTTPLVVNYTKSGVTFENGKYYTIDVKMDGDFVDLSSLPPVYVPEIGLDYEVQDGDVLTGTLPSGYHLSIPAGASVTLNGVTISDASRAGITCQGDATINLLGTNSITSTAYNYPGIQAGGSGTTLTIQGSGSVDAAGGYDSAGIGSAGTCGSIIINGGTVTARGYDNAAGIGSGRYGTCGSITITGGSVNATGGLKGAGIGSGSAGTCGSIIINGGTVTARGGGGAVGIGSGYESHFESISITKDITKVVATRGEGPKVSIGKGFGDQGSGSVTVDGVTNWEGSETTNLNFAVSTTTYDDDTWTLTRK